MRRWLKLKGIPFWPLGAYVLNYVQYVIGYRFDDIAPRNTIRAASCPVLLAHGTEDELVPASEAEEIYANRHDDRVELMLIPGSHDDYSDMEQHIGKVIRFLDVAAKVGSTRKDELQSPE
jgi:dipeptidyl aminopeptidase/acylaminoacyl peptidase